MFTWLAYERHTWMVLHMNGAAVNWSINNYRMMARKTCLNETGSNTTPNFCYCLQSLDRKKVLLFGDSRN